MHKLLKRAALASALSISLIGGSVALAAPANAAPASIANAKGRIWEDQLHAGAKIKTSTAYTILFQRTSSKLCAGSHNGKRYSASYTVYVLNSKLQKLSTTTNVSCYRAANLDYTLGLLYIAEPVLKKPTFTSQTGLLKSTLR